MILGLAGRSGSGKNFLAAQYLVPWGFYEVALADELKFRAVVTGAATYEDVFITKPPTVREWLQTEGTQRGRDVFGEDAWCRGLFARIRLMRERWGIERVVVTDVRFPNEVRFIQQHHGIVLKVRAPERVAVSALTEEQRQHSSETSVDALDALVDGFVLNDPAHSSTVQWQLASMLSYYGASVPTVASAPPRDMQLMLWREMRP